eukprot:6655553-Alexandrium_andersonii.AAC.1
MSASLVGSEMCIRDRGRRESATLWENRSSSRPHLSARLARQGTMGVREAVSYTHLTLPTICSV